MIDRWCTLALAPLIAIDVALGVVLRFWTTSKLWLDEAQSVNIAAHPLSQLTHYLRNDGAPPLYYALLHFWMGLFGHSDRDVRALSGVIAVITLGLAFGCVRAWWGTRPALVAVAVLAVMPYGVYFGTETRMYALIMAESTALLWVLRRHLDRPRWVTAAGIALLGASLLYTQYWAIYLLLVIGLFSVVHWWRQREAHHAPDWRLPAAIVSAFILWLPWVPIFLEQRAHTGTPWSPAPGFDQLFIWLDDFTVNQSVPAVIPSVHNEVTLVLFIALAFLGVLAAYMTRNKPLISVNVFGDPTARVVSFIVVATMLVGIVASHIDGAAYVPRYAAVIAAPVAFLVARGILVLNTPFRVLVILAVLSAACLWTDRWGVTDQRSQAGPVAAVLRDAPTDSVVYVCPDQLGPSLLRYANPRLEYLGYPRFTNPAIVNWYNYLAAYHRVRPKDNAATQAARIGANQPVYVVTARGYGLKLTCWYFTFHLAQDLHRTVERLVKSEPTGYYQPMGLLELVPSNAPLARPR